MNEPEQTQQKPPRKRYAAAEAAALSLPPMSQESCEIVGRLLAQVERRRAQKQAAPGQ